MLSRASPHRFRPQLIGCLAAAMAIALASVPLAAKPAGAVTPERVVSPGGIEAWLVADPTNPVISVEFAFRGGSALDPDGQEGLAGLVSATLNEGAGELDSQAFQERLETQAISLYFQADRDLLSGSLRTLSEKRDEAFELLRLSLTDPRFDEEAVDRMRDSILASIARNARRPGTLAGEAFREAVYGDHPYARPSEGTPASLAAIAPGDMHRFVQAQFTRDNLLIGVAGDVTPDELARLLDDTFGTLPETGEPVTVPAAELRAAGETIVVRLPVPQSQVLLGHGGPMRDDPEYPTAQILTYVLGGSGFSNRLTVEVRVRRGLAYGVGVSLSPRAAGGMVLGSVATRNEAVAESLEIIRREWQRMAEEGITETELEEAKTFLVGSFPLGLGSTGALAQLLMAMQYHDLGIDYIDTRGDELNAVTLEQANALAARLFDIDALTVVVVGEPVGVEATREKAPGAMPEDQAAPAGAPALAQ